MSESCRVRLTGPLVQYANGFRDELAGKGYAEDTAQRNLRILAHMSRWMADTEVPVGGLTPARVEEFIGHRRREGYRHWLSVPATAPLMEHLRQLGAAPKPEVIGPTTAADLVIADYRHYLLVERSLTKGVVRDYTRVAGELLAAYEQPGGLDLGTLTAAAVTEHVVEGCRRRSSGSLRFFVTALRSVLGYLFLTGQIDHQLAFAVPTVAHWGAGSLPRGISAEAVAALLGGCDEPTLVGLRDRAIVVLLARLGLRACEVTRLELDDLDWRAGEVSVSGKGGRRDRLPLPVDVGEAIVAYLHAGRPRVACRQVFLRITAPYVGLSTRAVTARVPGRHRPG